MKFEVNDEIAGTINIEFTSGKRKGIELRVKPVSFNDMKRFTKMVEGMDEVDEADQVMDRIEEIMDSLCLNPKDLPIESMPVQHLMTLITEVIKIARDGDERPLEEKKTEGTEPIKSSRSGRRASRSRR